MPKNLVPLLYLFLIIAAFYLLVIRPQRARARRTSSMQSQIGLGDEVMLTSGIFGTVSAVDDSMVFLTVADGVQIKVDRRAVGRTTRTEDRLQTDRLDDVHDAVGDDVARDPDGTPERTGRSPADDDPDGAG
jgi:preprotein translocase subunit YajC